MRNKLLLILILLSSTFLVNCGNFKVQYGDIDQPSEKSPEDLLPEPPIGYPGTKVGFTTQFASSDVTAKDGTAYKVETVLSPVQKQTTQKKGSYSFTTSIEGSVVR